MDSSFLLPLWLLVAPVVGALVLSALGRDRTNTPDNRL
jgi:hypothetical protein